MPINANYEFAAAEKHFYDAQTDEDKLLALEEMIKTMPSHKGAENLRANLRTRYKKLKAKIEIAKKRKKGSSQAFSIKKGEMQATLVGLTSTGKSSILKCLTNANPKIANYGFTTKIPEVGILNYGNCQIQILDLPAIGSDNFDTGIINTSDTALIVINNMSQIQEVEKVLNNFKGKRIIVFNKIDLLNPTEKRKLTENLKTKKHNFVLFSARTREGEQDLKDKIFSSFDKIRIYTKSPNQKSPDNDPVIMQPKSTIKDVARIILRGRIDLIKKARIWGPSSKFGGQEVGLNHELKDKDVVELSTR
jgi:ribosome-interacting GTPase 1